MSFTVSWLLCVFYVLVVGVMGQITEFGRSGEHAGEITGLAIDAAHSILVSTSRDKSIRLWDTITGRRLAILEEAHPDAIISLDLAYPSLLTSSVEGTAKIHRIMTDDGQDGRSVSLVLVQEIALGTGITATKLDGESFFVATTTNTEYTIREYSLQDGTSRLIGSHGNSVQKLLTTPSHLISLDTKQVQVRSRTDDSLLFTIQITDDSFQFEKEAVDVSPAGDQLFIGDLSHVKSYLLSDGTLLQSFRAFSLISSLRVGSTGQIVYLTASNTVYTYNLSGTIIDSRKTWGQTMERIVLDSTDGIVYTTTKIYGIYKWNMTITSNSDGPLPVWSIRKRRQYDGLVVVGRQAYVADDDMNINEFDLSSPTKQQTRSLQGIICGPAPHFLIVTTNLIGYKCSNQLLVMSRSDGTILKYFYGDGPTYAVGMTNQLAALSNSNTIHIFNVWTGARLMEFDNTQTLGDSVQILKLVDRTVYAASYSVFREWTLYVSAANMEFEYLIPSVTLALDVTGGFIYLGLSNGEIHILSTITRSFVRKLSNPGERVIAVTASPTGLIFYATNLNDPGIYLYNNVNEKRLLAKPGKDVGNLAVTDTTVLATASDVILEIVVPELAPDFKATETMRRLVTASSIPTSSSRQTSVDIEMPKNAGIGILEMVTIASSIFVVLAVIIGVISYVAYYRYKNGGYTTSLTTRRSPPGATESSNRLLISDPASNATAGTGGTKETQAKSVTTHVSNITVHEMSIPGFLEYSNGIDFITGKRVAKGGMGSIKMCQPTNPRLSEATRGETLVVKDFCMDVSTMAERIRTMFYQEIALMYRFRDESYIARIYGYSTSPACYIMKFHVMGDFQMYISGQSRATIMHPYTKRTLIRLLKHFSMALETLHSHSFAHCDVKPANALLDLSAPGELMLRIADFGLARLLDKSHLQVRAFEPANIRGLSTIYAAPEVFTRYSLRLPESDARIWTAGDVYALAITILEATTRSDLWLACHNDAL